MVETHSYKLSPFGPALQFGGGSSVISASSFWIRLAEVPSALEIFGLDLVSFVSGLGTAGASGVELPLPLPLRRPPPDPALLLPPPAPAALLPPALPAEPPLPVAVAPVVLLDPALVDMLDIGRAHV